MYSVLDKFIIGKTVIIKFQFEGIQNLYSRLDIELIPEERTQNISYKWRIKNKEYLLQQLNVVSRSVINELEHIHGINYFLKGVSGYSIEKNNEGRKEEGSEIYHFDNVNPSNYEYKLMILLSDVRGKDDGPLHFYPDFKITRNFKNFDQTRIKEISPEFKEEIFVGVVGDGVLFPTNMVHKQGGVKSENYTRKALILTFLPGWSLKNLPDIY
jgi:hypothetical protein